MIKTVSAVQVDGRLLKAGSKNGHVSSIRQRARARGVRRGSRWVWMHSAHCLLCGIRCDYFRAVRCPDSNRVLRVTPNLLWDGGHAKPAE